MKGYDIKEFYQLPDVSLVRHQFMVSGLPFTPQLMNYQCRVPVYLEQLDLEVDRYLDPKGTRLILNYIVCAVETQPSHERYIHIFFKKPAMISEFFLQIKVGNYLFSRACFFR